MSKPRAVQLQNLVNEGLAHHRSGHLEEAEKVYLRVLDIEPDHADGLHLAGMVAYQTGRLEIAAGLITKAITIHPGAASFHSNLGNVLQAQDKLTEAADSYRRALALKPDLPEVHLNLGNVMQALGNVDGSLGEFRHAIALNPDLVEARVAESMALLLLGDYARGWTHFEQRWQTHDYDTPWRAYSEPLWRGEPVTAGKVLVWGEQGVGDEIMFAGLIPDAVRTGTELVVECDRRLVPLFRRSFPGVEAVASGTPSRDRTPAIAAHLPSGSLPGLFRPSRKDFEATTSPYLVADAAERERFRARYSDGRLLVGLAWHTRGGKTGRKRSIDLTQAARLFEFPDLHWISLQYGDNTTLHAQAEDARAPVLIDRSVDQLADIDRFAAQVAAMDLVITIDNSTAHLAAALGIPTWLMLPLAPNWRWLLGTDRSPWYPTMRVFRQPGLGDWVSVIEQVRAALRTWIVRKDRLSAGGGSTIESLL
jgi:tetratricopeptide (TPR) repeat protein